MGTTSVREHRLERTPRVTVVEALVGPVAGALVGFATFAIAAVVIGSLLGTGELGLPDRNWETLGFGASIAAGLVLFVGFTYGAFVAGRLGGFGQHGLPMGIATFVAGVGLALLAAWAVQVGADSEEMDQYAQGLSALGVPGQIDGWRDIATTAGVSAVAGMLLGSLAGGALAHRREPKGSEETAK